MRVRSMIWGRLHECLSIGLLNNDAEAVKWYRMAAEQGFAGGQAYLGMMYGSMAVELSRMKWRR